MASPPSRGHVGYGAARQRFSATVSADARLLIQYEKSQDASLSRRCSGVSNTSSENTMVLPGNDHVSYSSLYRCTEGLLIIF